MSRCKQRSPLIHESEIRHVALIADASSDELRALLPNQRDDHTWGCHRPRVCRLLGVLQLPALECRDQLSCAIHE